MIFDERECLHRVGRGQGRISERLDLRDDVIADQRIVFHNKDGFVTTERRFVRRQVMRPEAVARGAWQVHLHRRAVAFLAVDFDMATRLLDETINHAEPKSGALADFFRGEEWIEHLVENSGGY